MTFVQNRKNDEKRCLPEEWNLGEYVRLSKEDGDKIESDSIQNQKRIIENHIQYLREHGEQIASVTVYSDDGYAGGNFNRPAYQRMIQDIENGKINCVIFKDNSRLGRNYPELGRLMEEYLPQRGIRVISVLNHLDSLRDPFSYSSAIVSFSNIVNDDYIRQLSIKIKSTLDMKRSRGEFIGNYAPYGYRKCPGNRHKLEIDPQAAEVVRMIFKWYVNGMSACGIVKQLNAMHILPPSVYKTQNGCKGFETYSDGAVRHGGWALTSVNTILRDEVYIGNLVQGKYKSISYRSKKVEPVERNEWTVVENTHEPIISFEQFAVVHDRIMRHTRVASNSLTHLLSGYIKCAHCGGSMNRVTSNRDGRYRCMTRTYDPGKCQCPSVKESLLIEAILKAVQRELNILPDTKRIIDNAKQYVHCGRLQNEYLTAIKQAEREKERLKEAKFLLYDNLQSGLLDQAEYNQFKSRYEEQIRRQDEMIGSLEKCAEETHKAREQNDEFVAYFQRYGSVKEIDRHVLNQILDHVEVFDSEHIDIFFKFISTKKESFEADQGIEKEKNGA